MAKKDNNATIDGWLDRIPVAWVDRVPDNFLLHLSAVGAVIGAGLLLWAWWL